MAPVYDQYYTSRHGIFIRYGMVWYGMVWYGMVWYGMVWYGMVWYGMVWYGMVWYGMVHDRMSTYQNIVHWFHFLVSAKELDSILDCWPLLYLVSLTK